MADAISDDISAILKEAQAALANGRSMPAGLYTDPAVFERERSVIHLTGWIFAGREEQVPSPGDYRAIDTVAGPVVLVRGDDSTLRAFANVCRHRGSLLLEGAGKCRRIVCPYHAWTYTLDGRLQGAPGMEDAPGFERADQGLIEARLETWAGFVFIAFHADAPPLMDHLGDLPDRMASHRAEDMHWVWGIELDCACNWKLLLENAMETYHTGTVHKDTVGAQMSRTLATRGAWHCIQVLSERSIATMNDDAGKFSSIPGLDDDALQGTYFTVIEPACQLVFAQDCIWWLNVIPKSPNRSVLEIGGCFPRATVARADFDAVAAPYLERWEAVGREDAGILERQQQGLESAAYAPGPLSARDDQVVALAERIIRKLEA